MSTELATRGQSSDLAIRDGQTFWTDHQLAALRQVGVENASDGDLKVFFHQAARTGLDPFVRQIYMIGRNTQNPRTRQWETKYTIQTGIDGYRLVARRVVDSRGETIEYGDTLWCGEDRQWTDVWVSPKPPVAAKVTIFRNGMRFSAIALWREYVQTTRDGQPNSMWSRMGSGQLAKCAEALALRKAFPQDLSGVYTSEEMGQADNHTEATPARTSSSPASAWEDAGAVESSEPITAKTRGHMFKLLAEFGFTDPEVQRQGMSRIVGRPVDSRATLTEDEGRAIVMDLEARKAATPRPTTEPGPERLDAETGEIIDAEVVES
jgi:phage recombination protein Bet